MSKTTATGDVVEYRRRLGGRLVNRRKGKRATGGNGGLKRKDDGRVGRVDRKEWEAKGRNWLWGVSECLMAGNWAAPGLKVLGLGG